MKSSITTPNQSISTLTFRPRTEQRFHELLNNPDRSKEETDKRIAQHLQNENGNADNKADDKAIETNKNEHDYVSLMVNDYFLKLAYL